MKFVLIVVWFALPQQEYADFSNVASRQPLGVTMQEFDGWNSCVVEAMRLASPYVDANCVPKSSAPSVRPWVGPWGVGEIVERPLAN